MKKRNPRHFTQVTAVLPKKLVKKIDQLADELGRNRTKQMEIMLTESVKRKTGVQL